MAQIIPINRGEIRNKKIGEIFTKEVTIELGFGSGLRTHLLNVFDTWQRYDSKKEPYYFAAPIRTFGDLLDLGLKELMRKPGLGKKTKEYVRAILARHGVEA